MEKKQKYEKEKARKWRGEVKEYKEKGNGVT